MFTIEGQLETMQFNFNVNNGTTTISYIVEYRPRLGEDNVSIKYQRGFQQLARATFTTMPMLGLANIVVFHESAIVRENEIKGVLQELQQTLVRLYTSWRMSAAHTIYIAPETSGG